MNMSLTPELEQLIAQKMATGDYDTAEAVVEDALKRMDEQDAWKELDVILKPRIEEARRGEVVTDTVSDIIADMKQQK